MKTKTRPPAALTSHARERGDERLALKPESIARMAELALQTGLRAEDTAGRLRRFLDGKRREFPGAHCRIYGEVLFWFRGTVLITLYQVPSQFRLVVRRLRAQHKARSKAIAATPLAPIARITCDRLVGSEDSE